jgi:hypothetical protein
LSKKKILKKLRKSDPFLKEKKRFVRYAEVKVKGQPVLYTVSQIRYRDKNGKLSKFRKGKLLSVEILAKKSLYDKKAGKWVERHRVIKKYGLKLAKRKKAVSIEATNKRIIRKAEKHKTGVTVVMEGGITRFISP